MNVITSVADLEAVLGRPAPPIAAKKATPCDEWTDAFIAAATIAWWASEDLRLAVASTRDLEVERVDDVVRVPFDAPATSPIGSLWMAYSHLETLRLNGTIIDDGLLQVSEQFLHCSKAFRRGQVWTHAVPVATSPETFRFAVVATCANGAVDISPRGDAPAVLRERAPDEYLIIDRPGNRLGDAFHNLLTNPAIEVALFGADAEDALILRGDAEVVVVGASTRPPSGSGLALHIHARERQSLSLPAGMWTSHAGAPPTMAQVVSTRSGGRVGAREVQCELDHDVEERLW
jgi:hypothetical protein